MTIGWAGFEFDLRDKGFLGFSVCAFRPGRVVREGSGKCLY